MIHFQICHHLVSILFQFRLRRFTNPKVCLKTTNTKPYFLVDSSSDNGAEGLDDWILRNFKGEALGSSPNSKSQGYSSAGCESPDASSSPESPSSSGQGDSASSTTSQAMKTIDQLPINWSGQSGQANSGTDRLESTDSAFSECNFSNRLNTVKDFVFKNEKS